jgi:hypothetical protein
MFFSKSVHAEFRPDAIVRAARDVT